MRKKQTVNIGGKDLKLEKIWNEEEVNFLCTRYKNDAYTLTNVLRMMCQRFPNRFIFTNFMGDARTILDAMGIGKKTHSHVLKLASSQTYQKKRLGRFANDPFYKR